MATYYINIDSSYPFFGDGTSSSPFNYSQFIYTLDPSNASGEGSSINAITVADGDVFEIIGAANFPSVGLLINLPNAIEYNLTFKNNGVVPTVFNFPSGSAAINIYSEIQPTNLNLTFDGIVFMRYRIGSVGQSSRLFHRIYKNGSYVFKNCLFYCLNKLTTGEYSDGHITFGTLGDISASIDLKFFGCSMFSQADGLRFTGAASSDFKIYLYDSILISGNDSGRILFDGVGSVIGDGNIISTGIYIDPVSTVGDFSGFATPIEDSDVTLYPEFSTYTYAKNYFDDQSNVIYSANNLDEVGMPDVFRTENGYAIDPWGNTRAGVGFYSFYVETVEYGKGSIGSFYFGPTYTNAIAEYTIPKFILAVPAFALDATAASDTIPTMHFQVPKKASNASVSVGFGFDFSATPLTGSIPLEVTFQAYNYLTTPGNAWKPVKFRWWFGEGETYTYTDVNYGNVTTPNDSITHVYCTQAGIDGNKYDVKLSIFYALK